MFLQRLSLGSTKISAVSEIENLIVGYIPRLRRYAMALAQGQNHIAEDLLQDALERALGKIHLWQADTDLRAWLFTIMHNVYVNQLRHIKNGPCFVELPETAGNDVGDYMASQLDLQDLQSALGQLPPDQREILLLVTLEGLPYKQVADIMAIAEGTVMSKLSRARQQLRKLLHREDARYLRRIK